MHEGYPHYLLHHGSPPSQWNGEWGYPYSWEARDPYSYDYYGDSYTGFDVSTIPDTAMKWGHEIGEQIGKFGSAAGEALKNVAKGAGSVMAPKLNPLGSVGETVQKAGTAAESTTLAAEEARRSIAYVTRRADATLDQIDKAAKEHEETVRVVKYVMIGIAVLGGAALVYSVTK
jgi:hypothetical protein